MCASCSAGFTGRNGGGVRSGVVTLVSFCLSVVFGVFFITYNCRFFCQLELKSNFPDIFVTQRPVKCTRVNQKTCVVTALPGQFGTFAAAALAIKSIWTIVRGRPLARTLCSCTLYKFPEFRICASVSAVFFLFPYPFLVAVVVLVLGDRSLAPSSRFLFSLSMPTLCFSAMSNNFLPRLSDRASNSM